VVDGSGQGTVSGDGEEGAVAEGEGVRRVGGFRGEAGRVPDSS